jgi:YihY family inner membrane protein
VVGALDGFREHQTSNSAALVAYFGFISVFPLFLVFTTVLGFVLQDDAELQEKIVDSALARLPLIGDKLASSPETLQGSWVALVVGLLLALWSGLKAFVAVQTALDNTNEIAIDARASFVTVRLRALLGIVIIGGAQVVTAFLTGIVTSAGFAGVGKVLLVVAAAFVNGVVLAFTYRFLTSATLTWRYVWPGAIVGGVLFACLQVVGTTIITRSQENASSVYGDFATVIALLAWLAMHATIALLGAEINRSVAHPIGSAEPGVEGSGGA